LKIVETHDTIGAIKMRQKKAELTAYCGLYCGDCIRYKSKAIHLASELQNELRKSGWANYAEVKSTKVKALKGYKQCCSVLEELTKLQCNDACRSGGGCPEFSCEIVKCCQKKNLEGCWLCGEFEDCRKFNFLKRYHGDSNIHNLRKIREFGLYTWAKQRQKLFIWQ
jgi:hypothetical protein